MNNFNVLESILNNNDFRIVIKDADSMDITNSREFDQDTYVIIQNSIYKVRNIEYVYNELTSKIILTFDTNDGLVNVEINMTTNYFYILEAEYFLNTEDIKRFNIKDNDKVYRINTISEITDYCKYLDVSENDWYQTRIDIDTEVSGDSYEYKFIIKLRPNNKFVNPIEMISIKNYSNINIALMNAAVMLDDINNTNVMNALDNGIIKTNSDNKFYDIIYVSNESLLVQDMTDASIVKMFHISSLIGNIIDGNIISFNKKYTKVYKYDGDNLLDIIGIANKVYNNEELSDEETNLLSSTLNFGFKEIGKDIIIFDNHNNIFHLNELFINKMINK